MSNQSNGSGSAKAQIDAVATPKTGESAKNKIAQANGK